jgi:hypothetical protein
VRKAIIELDPGSLFRYFARDLLKHIEFVETKEILKWEYKSGVKVSISDIKMKPGFTPNDLQLPEGASILAVLENTGNRYTCVTKFKPRRRGPAAEIWKLLDMDIILDLPQYLSKDRVVFACVGSERSLRRMVKFVKIFTKITKVQIQQAAFPEHSIVSHLTEKQREVITAARKYGYFEYPRRISASQLAERMGFSKTTTIEHLRKAENYILSRILVD